MDLKNALEVIAGITGVVGSVVASLSYMAKKRAEAKNASDVVVKDLRMELREVLEDVEDIKEQIARLNTITSVHQEKFDNISKSLDSIGVKLDRILEVRK